MNGGGKTSNRYGATAPKSQNRGTWIVAVLALGLACSCFLVAVGSMVTKKPGIAQGSGIVITENRPVGQFERISLNDMGTLIIFQGDVLRLTVETDDNLLRCVQTKVRGGTLVLGLSDGASDRALQPSQGITYRLSVPHIAGLEVADSGRIQAPSIEAESLEIMVQDSGRVDIDSLIARSLQMNVEDSGDVRLAGQVDEQDITVRDSGCYLAGQLQSQVAAVAASDSAEATLWATEALDVIATDAGRVRYYGHPKRTKRLCDNGKLTGLGAP